MIKYSEESTASLMILTAFVIAFIIPISILLQSCKVEEQSLVKRTDLYYSVIKSLVMEPAIHEKLTPEHIETLRAIEQVYLSARKIKDLKTIADCGIKILALLETLEIADKYQTEIKALRVALIALQVIIHGPENITGTTGHIPS